MPTQSPAQPSDTLEKELATASVSGAISTVGTVVYYATKPIASTSLEAGLFFVVLLSLGTFMFSMFDMILDQRDVFSEWIAQTSWSRYSLQAGLCVLGSLGVLGWLQNPVFSDTTDVLSVSVVYMTMVGVAVWITQESLTSA